VGEDCATCETNLSAGGQVTSRLCSLIEFAEIDAIRNQSERTVQRNWQKARFFLHQELSADLFARENHVDP
jgi:hypothetical protein